MSQIQLGEGIVFMNMGLTLLPAVTTPQPEGYRYGSGMMWHGDWFGMPGGTLIIIFWLGVVIVLVAPFMRWLGSDRSPSSQLSSEPSVPTPLSILQERYAPGAINKEEFEARRRILQDKQQSAAAGARYPIREISYAVNTNI